MLQGKDISVLVMPNQSGGRGIELGRTTDFGKRMKLNLSTLKSLIDDEVEIEFREHDPKVNNTFGEWTGKILNTGY